MSDISSITWDELCRWADPEMDKIEPVWEFDDQELKYSSSWKNDDDPYQGW